MFQEYKPEKIRVKGDDLVWNGQTYPIEQEIVYQSLTYNEDLSEDMLNSHMFGNPIQGNSLTVMVYVKLFNKNPDGTRGSRLAPGLIREYNHSFIANSSTLVNAADGSYVGVAGEEADPDNFADATFDSAGTKLTEPGKFFGMTVMRENAFFDMIADQPQQPGVRSLIKKYIMSNISRVQPKAQF